MAVFWWKMHSSTFCTLAQSLAAIAQKVGEMPAPLIQQDDTQNPYAVAMAIPLSKRRPPHL